MHFLRFVIGGFLILGSLIFAALLFFGVPLAIVTGSWLNLVVLAVIDFIAFLGGIYLVRHH